MPVAPMPAAPWIELVEGLADQTFQRRRGVAGQGNALDNRIAGHAGDALALPGLHSGRLRRDLVAPGRGGSGHAGAVSAASRACASTEARASGASVVPTGTAGCRVKGLFSGVAGAARRRIRSIPHPATSASAAAIE